MPKAPEKHTAVLAEFKFEPEARLMQTILQDHGINAETVGWQSSGFRAEAPGYARVIVLEEDLVRARKVMETARHDALEIDWSTVDLGEPEDD